LLDFWRLWNLALEGITSFSAAPLKLATLLGLLTSAGALGYGPFFLLCTLTWDNPVQGYPSLLASVGASTFVCALTRSRGGRTVRRCHLLVTGQRIATHGSER
jgi:hypothetical protein